MNGKKTFTLILLIATIFSCQTNGKPKGFDNGKVENNIYNNSFFNFKVELSPEWIVQSKEQTENLAKAGKELVVGDDDNLKAIIKASEINSAYLLTVFQYEVGSAVSYNPGFTLVAENLKLVLGIKNGGDYLFEVRKLLKQSQIQYNQIDSEFEKVNIDNQEFYKMNLALNYAGLNMKQSYYSTVLNGFSINAIISFVTDEQKNELEKVLNSFKFDK
jgi:hypothetical protein